MKIYTDITQVSRQTWALSATAQGLNPNLAICFPGASAGNESTRNAEDLGSIPGLEDLLEKDRLPTPVFWLGEFHELYSPRGCKESDTTERHLLSLSFHFTLTK